MIIIKSSLLKNYNGITLWPFLIISKDQSTTDHRFLNHEQIHAQQQKELLLIFFYVWYVTDYLILRLRNKHDAAYRKIVFEREAYTMENDQDYLKKRRPFSFYKYYRNNEH